MTPNLHSVTCSIYLSQLNSLLDAVNLKHASLRSLSINMIPDKKLRSAAAGPPGLESFSVRWFPNSSGVDYFTTRHATKSLYDLCWGLIQPSVDTLHDLRLAFQVGYHTGFSMLLKPVNLHTFHYEVLSTNTEMITQLPTIVPRVKNLSLLWKSRPRRPVFKVSLF
jgi:hypothetical protein